MVRRKGLIFVEFNFRLLGIFFRMFDVSTNPNPCHRKQPWKILLVLEVWEVSSTECLTHYLSLVIIDFIGSQCQPYKFIKGVYHNQECNYNCLPQHLPWFCFLFARSNERVHVNSHVCEQVFCELMYVTV